MPLTPALHEECRHPHLRVTNLFSSHEHYHEVSHKPLRHECVRREREYITFHGSGDLIAHTGAWRGDLSFVAMSIEALQQEMAEMALRQQHTEQMLQQQSKQQLQARELP